MENALEVSGNNPTRNPIITQMNLSRYNSNTPQVFREWDAFFEDPFRAFAPLLRSSASDRRGYASHVVWYEDSENFYARIDLPGVKRENLEVNAEDGLVHFSFVRSEFPGREGDDRKNERVLRSPEGVDLSKTSAKLADGVLELTLPKAEEAKPVTIEVR